MKNKKKAQKIRNRRTIVMLCLLAILNTTLPFINGTYAWFNDSSSSGVDFIRSAEFEVTVTVTEHTGNVNEDGYNVYQITGGDYTEEVKAKSSGEYTLQAGASYKFCLEPNGTATQGYCTVTGMESPISPIRFTKTSRDSTEFYVTVTGNSAATIQISAHWGDPDKAGVQRYSIFEPLTIEDGGHYNEYGEPITLTFADYIRPTYDDMGMPWYYQDNYPNVGYGDSNIAREGCGIVSLAMVGTYLSGHEYYPEQLARWFGGMGTSNVERLEAGIEALRLPVQRVANLNELINVMTDHTLTIVRPQENTRVPESSETTEGNTDDTNELGNTDTTQEEVVTDGTDHPENTDATQDEVVSNGTDISENADTAKAEAVSEDTGDAENADAEKAEVVSEDTGDAESADAEKDAEASEDTGDAESADAEKDKEVTEDTDDAENVDAEKDAEASEDTDNLEDLDSAKDTVTSDSTEDSENTESTDDKAPSDDNGYSGILVNTNSGSTDKNAGDTRGKVAIILVNSNSPFTDDGHFLVIKDITEDGLFLLNDPNKQNYSKTNLVDGFENGFSLDMIAAGYQSAWVFDPAEMEPGFVYSQDGNTILVGEHDLPVFYQNDYPNQRYGNGTVATEGCGATALAMVASYMTPYDYAPDELARYFGGTAENNIQRMLNGADALNLPYEKAQNIDKAMSALRQGKIVIELVDHNNTLTTTQHFIVWRGLTAQGRILVSDPNRQNYERQDLSFQFENGFLMDELLQGWQGAWIFDPDAVPEDIAYYYEEDTLDYDNPNYDVDLTYEEQLLIAKVIFAESRGEPDEGQQAVAEVVLNRYVNGGFGNSIEGVVYSDGAFNSVAEGYVDIETNVPGQAQYDALDRALYGENILPKDVYYFATESRAPEDYFTQIHNHYFW